MKPVRQFRTCRGAIGACTLMAAFCLPAAVGQAGGQQKQGDDRAKTAQEEKINADLSRASLAARLAIEGENRQSPFLLLAAAEIVGDLRQSERSIEGVVAKRSGGTAGAGRPMALDMKSLIARARELTKGNEKVSSAVETMIESIEDPSRGLVHRQGKDLPSVTIGETVYKVLNPEAENQRIDAGGNLTLEKVVFEGGLPAEVVVVGDGDGDLDLWVYDAKTDGLIGEDIDPTSICVVRWVPREEGPFRIEVKNVGKVWERFFILANW